MRVGKSHQIQAIKGNLKCISVVLVFEYKLVAEILHGSRQWAMSIEQDGKKVEKEKQTNKERERLPTYGNGSNELNMRMEGNRNRRRNKYNLYLLVGAFHHAGAYVFLSVVS
ncbi:hypothetical protein VNO77_00894 [Canavalia gladiata]|uniref:Transmembrane protein n=1 Tax=Canavalia gladiata TaxID=3824 RepID=A0AAN9R4H5_CANGL